MSAQYSSKMRGFTLLEVLISVVVLSVGLLALTALQGALLRASSDSKARSSAVALATDQLERMRAFTSVGSAETCTAASRSYQCLMSLAKPSAANASDTGPGGNASDRGGVDFKRWWTVTRYIPNAAGGYSSTTDLTAANVASPLGPSEFKVVEVNVEWVDARGDAQTVTLRDAIASIDPSNSMRLMAGPPGGGRGIQKRIFNPANDSNVIPVATGSGSEAAAASDPKPQTFGASGKVSTSFTVQTYSSDTQGFVVRNEFESKVVSCNCKLEAGPATGGVLEPAYWDGDRYVPPALRRTAAGAVRTNDVKWGSRNTAVAQDATGCDVCCRNHHDTDGPLTVNTTDPAKTAAIYDPYRDAGDVTSSNHNHYRRTALGPPPTFVLAGNNTNYDEVCRLVRVDGVFRVTPDLRLEDIKQLSMSGSPAILDSGTRAAYSNYAANFIDALWAQLYGGTLQASLLDVTPTPSDGLGQTSPVLLMAAGQTHDLTARAIFLDWLHPVTIAKAKCAGQTSNATCLQKYRSAVNRTVRQIVPFLTVNLTNLAEWRSADVPKVSVTNDPIPNTLNTPYGRGNVVGVGLTTSPVQVSARTYRGPVALADQLPINPVEAGVDPYTTGRPRPIVVTRGFSVLGAGEQTEFKLDMVGSGTGPNFKPEQIGASLTNGSCARGNPVTRHDCSLANVVTNSTITIRNYNTVVVNCGNGNGNPRDPQDPSTVCVKNNGVENPPVSVDLFLFNVCSISGPEGATFARQEPVRTNASHPATEYTQFIATFSPDATLLASQTLTATFVPAASTCP